MATRRPRRTGRQQNLLPIRSDEFSNSLSCWYCDWKVRALNATLFSIGNRYARFLQVWFSVGAAFGLVALVGMVVLLIWELVGTFHLHNDIFGLDNPPTSWFFGISPLASGLSIWILNAGILFFSTSISVAVHEFGHAIAAASEGIQIEYIAIFLSIIFPGALVALNYDSLESLPRFAALRIYCAGIWHNLTFCAVCGITLFLLPLILYPLYIHGGMPMVLEVPQTSPLSGYLSYGDIIEGVDGSRIGSPSEWTNKMILVHSQMLHKAVSGMKGYCAPTSWLDGINNTQVMENNFSCPDELATFVSVPCINSSLTDGIRSEGSSENIREIKQCLNAKDVVKLKKCGHGWELSGTDRNNCACSEEEACMMPVQTPGLSWVEISYLSPYSSECLQLRKNTPVSSEISDYSSTACGGSFVFIGDILSMSYSIRLSSYRPRWQYLSANMPTLLESILSCTFHVSATLAVLNSSPVFFLDGESILETSLYCITCLNPTRRRKVLKLCLIGGSILSVTILAKILYPMFVLSFGY